MSKRSTGSGIGIGTLIFWAWIGYTFFIDNDSDKKEMIIENKAQQTIVEPVKEEKTSIAIELNSIVKQAKEELEGVKKDLKEAVDEVKNSRNIKKNEEIKSPESMPYGITLPDTKIEPKEEKKDDPNELKSLDDTIKNDPEFEKL